MKEVVHPLPQAQAINQKMKTITIMIVIAWIKSKKNTCWEAIIHINPPEKIVMHQKKQVYSKLKLDKVLFPLQPNKNRISNQVRRSKRMIYYYKVLHLVLVA